MMSITTTTVLGKRNRAASETLLLQLSASESNHEQSDVSWQEPESEAESPQTSPKLEAKIRVCLGEWIAGEKREEKVSLHFFWLRKIV
jgi:hypothetical protein